MDIIINQQKIDYQLQGEKTLREIISELDKWIRDGDFVIQEVKVDRTSFDFERNVLDERFEFFEKSPADVNCLEIIAKPRFEIAYSTLMNISRYVKSLLSSNGRFGNVNDYDNLLEGIELIYEGVSRSVGILGLKPEIIFNENGESLAEVMELFHELLNNYRRRFFDREGVKKLENILETIDGLFEDILKLAILENTDVFSSLDWENADALIELGLKNLLILNDKIISLIGDIVENLQIGNDGSGFKKISRLMEYIGYTISGIEKILFSFESSDKKIIFNINEKKNTLFKSITELLRKIESSFDRMDIIGIMEIMDSELRKSILDLKDLLINIEKLIG